MPSFQDSALIFFIALLLFGPKKLPELARQLGKLMGEFRRASNEFRMQMEDELRIADQAEQQKKIAAMQAAAPVSPTLNETGIPAKYIPDPEHPHMPSYEPDSSVSEPSELPAAAALLPIATSGEFSIMPPATGLPAGRSAVSAMLDAIPHDESDGSLAVPDMAATQQVADRKQQQEDIAAPAEVHLNG